MLPIELIFPGQLPLPFALAIDPGSCHSIVLYIPFLLSYFTYLLLCLFSLTLDWPVVILIILSVALPTTLALTISLLLHCLLLLTVSMPISRFLLIYCNGLLKEFLVLNDEKYSKYEKLNVLWETFHRKCINLKKNV